MESGSGTLETRSFPETIVINNIAAWLPPFWLSPGKAMAMR
jgi:hypothetical protein